MSKKKPEPSGDEELSIDDLKSVVGVQITKPLNGTLIRIHCRITILTALLER